MEKRMNKNCMVYTIKIMNILYIQSSTRKTLQDCNNNNPHFDELAFKLHEIRI